MPGPPLSSYTPREARSEMVTTPMGMSAMNALLAGIRRRPDVSAGSAPRCEQPLRP